MSKTEDYNSTKPLKAADNDSAIVSSMFGDIASDYDFLNHFLSLGIDLYWRKVLVESARPGPVIVSASSAPLCLLDLAAGTLDVSIALAKAYSDFQIIGMDLCLPMLQKGLPKLEKLPLNKKYGKITPITGNAFAIPLKDASIDSITIAFGLRNMRPRGEAFAEFRRVLKPGGKLCVLEFGSAKQKVWLGLYNFYLSKILPCVGGIVSGNKNAYIYLAQTIKDFPLPHELASEMQDAGFNNISFKSLSSGIVYLHTAVNP